MKYITLIIILLANTAIAENDSHSINSSTDKNGLVGKVQNQGNKISRLEQTRTICRVEKALDYTTVSQWTNASKAKCLKNEYATGGGCISEKSNPKDDENVYGATGMVMQNGDKPIGFQCVVNQDVAGKIRAQAVCCSFNKTIAEESK